MAARCGVCGRPGGWRHVCVVKAHGRPGGTNYGPRTVARMGQRLELGAARKPRRARVWFRARVVWRRWWLDVNRPVDIVEERRRDGWEL